VQQVNSNNSAVQTSQVFLQIIESKQVDLAVTPQTCVWEVMSSILAGAPAVLTGFSWPIRAEIVFGP
jgi:hypothetical protein